MLKSMKQLSQLYSAFVDLHIEPVESGTAIK